MSQPYRQETTYTDELLADRSVHRRYSDGRQEWRARGERGTVRWRDDRGGSGTDELLGRRIVKRTLHDGRVLYGREGGYGRTLWSDGVLTVNRTSFGGRMGTVLAAVAGGALIGTLAAPPGELTPEQEEELRSQAEAGADVTAGGGDGGGDAGGGDGGGDAGYGDDFEDFNDDGFDDDFG